MYYTCKNTLYVFILSPFSVVSMTFSSQTKLLTQYVLNLAKYDQNYDIRDRARFIRQLIVPTEKSGALSKYAKKLFLALKPAPVLESPFKGTEVKFGIRKINYFSSGVWESCRLRRGRDVRQRCCRR